MKEKGNKNLWQFREASTSEQQHYFILVILVTGGIISIIRFADWWFTEDHIGNLAFYVLLSLLFWYGMTRLILIWINYLRIKKPEHIRAEKGLRVAIFTTSSPGEPLEMFLKTLAACKNITYPHTTYLLDDTKDVRFKEAAEKYGAVWLEIVGEPGAKAGKINKALSLTTEDFILVMDPDHIPFPNFLDQTLGYFKDEKTGFVQVAQAYYNQYRSFTAKGAAEQTYTFYGPTQMALHGHGCAVAIGANCTFRRKALESIGGHGIGLAEDLITSIRIHAAGWNSVYNPVVVSRGLVPEDFGSFCKQQLKWSRGVFEVLFEEYPKLYKKLTGWQRLSYLTIGTYYLVGATSFFFTLIPFLFFVSGVLPAKMYFVDFLMHGFFILFFSMAIYLYVQKWLCHKETERGIHWRGMVLKFGSWPVFLLGFLLSIVNADIPYIPTAKKAVVGYFTPFARPLLLQCFLFVMAIIYVFVQRRYWTNEEEVIATSQITWGMMAFSLLAFIMAMGGILAALEARKLKEEDSWDTVNLKKITINTKQ